MIGHYSIIQYHSNPVRQEGTNWGVILVRSNYASLVKIQETSNKDFDGKLEALKVKILNTIFTVNDLRNWPRYPANDNFQLTYPVSLFMTTEDTISELYSSLVI